VSKKDRHPLNGHQELYKRGEFVDTYLKVTRHLVRKNKTYFMYYFPNPRKDKQEPDVYRYYFRILWGNEPRLQQHIQYIATEPGTGKVKKVRSGFWEDSDKHSDFNLFPNYNGMVDKIKSLIAEYELLYNSTDPNDL